MTDFKAKGPFEPDDSELYAGIDSAVLNSQFVASALERPRRDAPLSNPLSAALGIRNGVLIGIACWILVYFLVRLFSM